MPTNWIDNCLGILLADFPAIPAYASYRAKSGALHLLHKNPVEDGNEYYLG
jgi:hypothetical protein